MKNALPAILSCLLLSACVNPFQSGADPKTHVQIQLSSEPVSLDPALAEDGVSMRVLSNVMDGLVGYDGEGKLQKRLAESWKISPDGRRYEFTLRRANWSDGHPVQAEDFVTGIRRSLDAHLASKLADIFFPIRGARAWHSGKGSAEALGVSGQGQLLAIELEEPAPYFLEALTLLQALPIREDFLKSHGGRWTREAPVTGPYRIAAHAADREIRLEPNPEYWDESVKPLPVLLRVVSDETTALNLFDQGKLDIITKVPAFDLKRMKQRGLLHTDPFVATYFLSFNTRKPPFNDRDWRRAVSGVIRREEIVQALDSGELPAWSWIPKGIEGYVPYHDPTPPMAGSVMRVRAELKKSHARVEASFDTSGRNSMIMEKIQHDLKRGLGLDVTLRNQDWKTHVASLGTDPAPIFRFGWLSPFNDPITQMQAFTTGNPNNYSGWSSRAYDRLVAEIGHLAPGRKRDELLRQAQEILIEDEAAVVPLFHYVQTHAVARRVTGFRASPNGNVRFSELGLSGN